MKIWSKSSTIKIRRSPAPCFPGRCPPGNAPMTYLVRVPPMLGAAVLATIGVPLYALLGAAGEQEDFVRSSPHNSRGCLACSVVPKLTFWGGNLFPLGYNSSPVRQWTLQGHFPAGRLLHAGGKCASGG